MPNFYDPSLLEVRVPDDSPLRRFSLLCVRCRSSQPVFRVIPEDGDVRLVLECGRCNEKEVVPDRCVRTC